MKSYIFSFFLLLGFFITMPAAMAQNQPKSGDIEKSMEQMQQQMMQLFEENDSLGGLFGGGSPFQMFGDTSFFFQGDSALLGKGGLGGLFKMQPFGIDENGDMDMNQMLQSFGDLMQMFGGEGGHGFWIDPEMKDNGASDSDMLPEERLRLEEEGGTVPTKQAQKKRKTVKI